MKNLAIFASGSGSNAQKIIDYFDNHNSIRVALIVSNKADAGVLTIAQKQNIPFYIIQRKYFYDSENILAELQQADIQYIALAGFLWLIPAYLIRAFSNRIINIHPALLPKYGGKGMHGAHVHEAVKTAAETESGVTIHEVNERYDEGKIIFQATCDVFSTDSATDIAKKVLRLEHEHFAPVIARWINVN
jgi:phosphoribosylglycinamide formyltransferase-1